jgi:hypothetical protein
MYSKINTPEECETNSMAAVWKFSLNFQMDSDRTYGIYYENNVMNITYIINNYKHVNDANL